MGNVSVLKTYSRIFQMPYYQYCLIFYFKSVLLEILSYTDGTLSVLISTEFPTWHHEHESPSHCGFNNDQQSNPWIRFWKSCHRLKGCHLYLSVCMFICPLTYSKLWSAPGMATWSQKYLFYTAFCVLQNQNVALVIDFSARSDILKVDDIMCDSAMEFEVNLVLQVLPSK